MKTILSIFLCSIVAFVGSISNAFSQKPLYEKMALTAKNEINQHPIFADSSKGPKWTYDLGVVLEGFAEVWRNTGDASYFELIQHCMDRYISEDGNILNYKKSDFNIDNVKNGKSLLLLYKVTGKEKYLKACHKLYEQMLEHPKTKEGGFWHKKIYPYQMWLDGLYMAQPFLAEYADLMDKPEIFDEIIDQFTFMQKHARDSKTGLLFHGWDESKEQMWANKQTGTSPHFWARGIGWYAMALIDVLDYFPKEHERRSELIAILDNTMHAVLKYQDKKSGVWNDIIDLPNREGNYLEASASSMFVYSLAKGVRKGYLPIRWNKKIHKAFVGLQKEFVKEVDADRIDLDGIVAVSGLGGAKNYRDGSFEYYMSEPVVTNDFKGIGSFILAASEMEAYKRPTKPLAKQPLVMLDNYYNNEYKKSPSGIDKPYHYLWDGMDNNGFHFFGNIFEHHGARLDSLREAPTLTNLKNADVYIIVDPDTEKETLDPNFMNELDASNVAQWVKKGGVLLIFSNDLGNNEIKLFNKLTEKFGITVHEDSRNRVKGRDFEMGALQLPLGHEIFKSGPKVYLKEISTLGIERFATASFTDDNDVLIATSRYGKGTVFVVGDPWFYNEYVDGRKLPPTFQNFKAANELASWALDQVK